MIQGLMGNRANPSTTSRCLFNGAKERKQKVDDDDDDDDDNDDDVNLSININK